MPIKGNNMGKKMNFSKICRQINLINRKLSKKFIIKKLVLDHKPKTEIFFLILFTNTSGDLCQI